MHAVTTKSNAIDVNLARFNRSNRQRWGIVLLSCLVIPLASCVRTDHPLGSEANPFRPARSGNDADIIHKLAAQVSINVYRLPLGTSGQSQQIWSLLDEESVGARKATLLTKNGLRVGRADPRQHKALMALLRSHEGAQTLQQNSVLDRQKPVLLPTNSLQGEQQVFIYRLDDTLHGNSYQTLGNYFALRGFISPEDADATILEIRPQIRLPSGPPSYRRKPTGLGYMLSSDPPFHKFDELTVTMPIPLDHVAMVGPAVETETPFTVGENFLVETIDDQQYETLLLLRPRVIHMEIQRRSAFKGQTSEIRTQSSGRK